jgi:hypothetical protein
VTVCVDEASSVAYFADLTPYSFLASAATSPALNVGWLDPTHSFHQGATESEFHHRLFTFCEHPVHRTRGIHRCAFCPVARDSTAQRETLEGRTVVLGSAEIRVGGAGVIYAAPDLIYHYVVRHQYHPPDEFIRAVLGGTERMR